LDKDVREKLKATSNVAAAEEVGKLVAERAVKQGSTKLYLIVVAIYTMVV
jgi:ribosomal protein L18